MQCFLLKRWVVAAAAQVSVIAAHPPEQQADASGAAARKLLREAQPGRQSLAQIAGATNA